MLVACEGRVSAIVDDIAVCVQSHGRRFCCCGEQQTESDKRKYFVYTMRTFWLIDFGLSLHNLVQSNKFDNYDCHAENLQIL